jgi:hypothetical protein
MPHRWMPASALLLGASAALIAQGLALMLPAYFTPDTAGRWDALARAHSTSGPGNDGTRVRASVGGSLRQPVIGL